MTTPAVSPNLPRFSSKRQSAADRQLSFSGEQTHETYFSTEPNQAGPYPRLPCPHGYQGWSQGHKRASCQGPRPPDTAISAVLGLPGNPGGFPRNARLLSGDDFRRVFEAATRSGDAVLTVIARSNGGSAARLGLAIAKKNLRRAVDRNRLKRIVRASFREARATLNGWDIVVMARPAAAGAPRAELHASLARHWQRLAQTPFPNDSSGRLL